MVNWGVHTCPVQGAAVDQETAHWYVGAREVPPRLRLHKTLADEHVMGVVRDFFHVPFPDLLVQHVLHGFRQPCRRGEPSSGFSKRLLARFKLRMQGLGSPTCYAASHPCVQLSGRHGAQLDLKLRGCQPVHANLGSAHGRLWRARLVVLQDVKSLVSIEGIANHAEALFVCCSDSRHCGDVVVIPLHSFGLLRCKAAVCRRVCVKHRRNCVGFGAGHYAWHCCGRAVATQGENIVGAKLWHCA